MKGEGAHCWADGGGRDRTFSMYSCEILKMESSFARVLSCCRLVNFSISRHVTVGCSYFGKKRFETDARGYWFQNLLLMKSNQTRQGKEYR